MLRDGILNHHSLKPGFRVFALLSILVIATGCATLPEQEKNYDAVYSPQQLRDDLKFIDEQLRSIHPNLFYRQSNSEYQKRFQQTYDNLSWPRNRRRFYTTIMPLVASFQDTHIQLQLPKSEFLNFATQQGPFPLKVLITDNEMIVLSDEQELPTIPVGAIITEINNFKVADLLPLLEKMVPAETETGRIRLVQVHLPELLWAFFPDQDRYTITYEWRGKSHSESLHPLLHRIDPESFGPYAPTSHYGAIPIDDKTSILWLNDFNENYDDFENFINSFFTKLRADGKQNLILDLRYNRGGVTDNLKLLLSYLSDRPVNWAHYATLKVSSAFKDQHSQLVDDTKSEKYTSYLGWLPMEYLNLWQWELLFSSEGDVLETSLDPVVKNLPNYFKGNIIVLSNGYCFSACAALVSNLKNHGLATVIGESPGSYVGRQFGYPVEVKLPNTGLILSVPAMEFVLHHNVGNHRYLKPDHKVTRRKMDVMMGYDVVFQAALELIKLREQYKELPNITNIN